MTDAARTYEVALYVTVESHAVKVLMWRGTGAVVGYAKTRAALEGLAHGIAIENGAKDGDRIEMSFITSSSVAFADEYTSDENVLKLCRWLSR